MACFFSIAPMLARKVCFVCDSDHGIGFAVTPQNEKKKRKRKTPPSNDNSKWAEQTTQV